MFENSTVVACDDQTWTDFDGDIVILNFKSGKYFGLKHVGARIWTLIQQPKTPNEICEALLVDYELDVAALERDIAALLNQLAEQGLIKVNNGNNS